MDVDASSGRPAKLAAIGLFGGAAALAAVAALFATVAAGGANAGWYVAQGVVAVAAMLASAAFVERGRIAQFVLVLAGAIWAWSVVPDLLAADPADPLDRTTLRMAFGLIAAGLAVLGGAFVRRHRDGARWAALPWLVSAAVSFYERDVADAIAAVGIVAVAVWSLRLAAALRDPHSLDPSGGRSVVMPPRRRPAGRKRTKRGTPPSGRTGRRPGAEPLTTPRLDAVELGRRTGIAPWALDDFRPTYRSVEIPKRGGGTRRLLVPDDETKALQRTINRRLLARLPVHPACHGFERGRSIVTNALPHAGRAVVIRLDLEHFFESTSTRRVRRFYRVLGWDRDAARILTRVTTADGGLPQGAPTSPRLANLVNVRVDARLAGLAAALGAVYTRYADDLTFSFATDDRAATHDLIRAVKRIVRQHGYVLHEGRKLTIRRRHARQVVTGLVVNERPALARRTRRWLRAVEHHVYSGREASLTKDQLAGWQALEAMIETERPGSA